MTNVASGTYEHVNVLIQKGAVDKLISLLASPHIEVIEQAIWGIGNIAGDGPRIRDIVISAGAVEPISNLLD